MGLDLGVKNIKFSLSRGVSNMCGRGGNGGGQEYIESDGVAYTKLNNSSDFYVKKIKIKFKTFDESSLQNNKFVFGQKFTSGYNEYRYGLITSYYSGYKFGVYNGYSAGGSVKTEVELPNNNDIQAVEIILNPTLKITSSFVCFGYLGSSNVVYAKKNRIYYIEFYSASDVLFHKYIPKKVNGEAGLYDEIGNVFYGNVAGAGQLILGKG